MSIAPKKYSTLVEYCFRNGGANQYFVLNSATIITDGKTYSSYGMSSNIYNVSSQRIIDALPPNFLKRFIYSYCIAAVKTEQFPYYYAGVSTFFRPYQEDCTAYVILLSNQKEL